MGIAADLRKLAFPVVVAAACVPAAAQDDGYPVTEVLEAFGTACSGAENTLVNLASAEAAGWERLPEGADTPISNLSRQGKAALLAQAAAEGEPAPEMIAGGEFRKDVAGRTLYLVVSGIRMDDIASRGCRLYDFDAPRGFSAEELEGWAVRAPNDREESPDGITKTTFNPGLKPGHMEMQAYFIPPGADPVAGITLTGIGLVATAIDF